MTYLMLDRTAWPTMPLDEQVRIMNALFGALGGPGTKKRRPLQLAA